MMIQLKKASFCSLILASNFTLAAPITKGELTYYKAPTSDERCVILDKIPGGLYSKKDLELEKKLCAIDFHNTPDVALCAKTWSTSPGVIVYDVKSTQLSKEEFVNTICKMGKTKLAKKLAKFKTTMWEEKTSSTYHKSSLAYYHLSRFFETSLIVPVSIYREIDHSVHYDISLQGQKSSPNGAIKHAWNANVLAHQTKETYPRSDIFFNEDKTTVQGIMTKDSGDDVGPLIDGINSQWGKQSTLEFAETPAFMALKTNQDLDLAIKNVLDNYSSYIDKNLKKYSKGIFNRGNLEVVARLKEMKNGLPYITNLQMKSWMNELNEIMILDIILGQEDRNLNIAAKWYKYKITEDKITSDSIDDKILFSELNKIEKLENEIIIQRIALNDNDAALLPGSTNFMRATQLIESIHHFNPHTYKKLLQLQDDFQKQTGTYQYLRDTLLLTKRELSILTDNIYYVTETLKKKCLANSLRFDLSTIKSTLEGKISSSASSTNCVL